MAEDGAKLIGVETMTHVPLLDEVEAPEDPMFREELMYDHPPRVVNVSTRNICEIPSQLAQGFLDNTDWSYWALSTWEASWLHERMWWQVDYKDAERREEKMMKELLLQADIIHLNGYHTWSFLRDLKDDLLGKKMVIHHHGIELRDDPRGHHEETLAGYTRVVSTPDLLLCDRNLHWLPSPVPIAEIQQNYPLWDKDPHGPCIVGHAYTVKENKGTDFIEKAINDATGIGTPVWPMLWHGVQKRQSIWLLSQCDVYFATMKHGPGLASYEAMALGIPVVLSCTANERAAQQECYGDDLPFIYVTEEDAVEKLGELASDPDMRLERGMHGREVMTRHHNIVSVVERMKSIYEEAQPCQRVIHRSG